MTVTLITGASSGIGRSLARRIAAAGDPVAVAARRKELLESLVAEIEATGGLALALVCDVTDPDQVHAAVKKAEAELGPIERLIANAGGGEPTFADAFQASQIRRVLELNVLGTAHCIEAVLPAMIERGSGHIVAMSSLAAYRALPSAGAYSGAKAALTNLLESLRIDLAPRGIDVTVISPGFVHAKPSKRGKPSPRGKPFRVELEDATRRIHRAIEARRRSYAFPGLMAGALSLARLLPAGIWDRALAGRGRRKQASRASQTR